MSYWPSDRRWIFSPLSPTADSSPPYWMISLMLLSDGKLLRITHTHTLVHTADASLTGSSSVWLRPRWCSSICCLVIRSRQLFVLRLQLKLCSVTSPHYIKSASLALLFMACIRLCQFTVLQQTRRWRTGRGGGGVMGWERPWFATVKISIFHPRGRLFRMKEVGNAALGGKKHVSQAISSSWVLSKFCTKVNLLLLI